MTGQILKFNLPFAINESGFPAYSDIHGQGLACGAMIIDLDTEKMEFLSESFELQRNSIIKMYVYDGSLDSFGIFNVGVDSLRIQIEKYSTFNMIFECELRKNYLFVSDDLQRIIFAGLRGFVDRCMSLVESPVAEAESLFETSFFDDFEVSEGLAFLRTYNVGRMG